MEELHKRYDGRKATESIPHAESFSELRGYSRQTIDSLKSEFGTVAQHLTDQHPSVANGWVSPPCTISRGLGSHSGIEAHAQGLAECIGVQRHIEDILLSLNHLGREGFCVALLACMNLPCLATD